MVSDHSFSGIKARADNLAAEQVSLGMPPLGLNSSFPGLVNVFREGDPDADVLRQPADFYSPDTFNYASLDVSAGTPGSGSFRRWGGVSDHVADLRCPCEVI